MQGIFRKENTDKALKYGIYRHLPTYEKIIRNLVSFSVKKIAERIDISRRTVENNIKKMKESDIVVRHGSPKNGCWEIVE